VTGYSDEIKKVPSHGEEQPSVYPAGYNVLCTQSSTNNGCQIVAFTYEHVIVIGLVDTTWYY